MAEAERRAREAADRFLSSPVAKPLTVLGNCKYESYVILPREFKPGDVVYVTKAPK
jgi:hypothetical protein